MDNIDSHSIVSSGGASSDIVPLRPISLQRHAFATSHLRAAAAASATLPQHLQPTFMAATELALSSTSHHAVAEHTAARKVKKSFRDFLHDDNVGLPSQRLQEHATSMAAQRKLERVAPDSGRAGAASGTSAFESAAALTSAPSGAPVPQLSIVNGKIQVYQSLVYVIRPNTPHTHPSPSPSHRSSMRASWCTHPSPSPYHRSSRRASWCAHTPLPFPFP